MGLSRLDNFLKSSRGTILYVDPGSLDSTDSIENQGNSLTRPFKTIQRALLEASRFSYQRGLHNDRFGKTTIMLYPGDHIVDNRPGFIPDETVENRYYLRGGSVTGDLPPLSRTSNFDLSTPNNELFKLNSVHGGIIVPRGTSIIGMDVRKTKIIPKYVPDPKNTDISRSAIFRLTGTCYISQVAILDGDPNGSVYKDYTVNEFVPNFSHHKLTCFEYADGVNPVNIDDRFLTYTTHRTDLDMYYEKVGLVYGDSSGRAIEPDHPSNSLDIQPKVDEYRIVGSTGQTENIQSIFSGDGVTSSSIVTLTTENPVPGLDVDTPFRVENITEPGYSGQFVVSEKVSPVQIKYQIQNPPSNPTPSAIGGTVSLQMDTVTSGSPYIFNCSLRSVYGMCGLHADGSKADGFKSMVVAQFTGIGLQKDDNAFVIFNQSTPPTGNYDDSTTVSNLSNNSRSRYRQDYRNYHIKASNNSIIQAVSIFAIGFSEHFFTESGGEISLTNSNSNFGANALTSDGFREKAFSQDDSGYITHIIPPKEIPLTENSIEFNAIDIEKTVSVGNTTSLYLYGQTNFSSFPENVIEGFRIGARVDDKLGVLISSGGVTAEHTSTIVMPGTQSSSEKSFTVGRSVSGINSIGTFSDGGEDGVITLSEPHTLSTGESIRIYGSTGQIPDGLTPNTVYYAITDNSKPNNIKIAKTLNDSLLGNSIPINGRGEVLTVKSKVSDKNSGDIGHPIQYDSTAGQWFINVSDDGIYSAISSLSAKTTPRTFIRRRKDSRDLFDTIYRVRYVIPASSTRVSRAPIDGFVLQESNHSMSSNEIDKYFGSGSLSNENEHRNLTFIAGISWDLGIATITTEIPHNLSIGSTVELFNCGEEFNGTYKINSITAKKQFTIAMADPGVAFGIDVNTRNESLPYFTRKYYDGIYYTYKINESQRYIAGQQDGIYYLTLINSSNSPTVVEFSDDKFSQPVKNLFPQTNRDNPVSDPKSASSFASSGLIGEVVVDDPQNSITKETTEKILRDTCSGSKIEKIVSQTALEHTITTKIDHGLNRITRLSISDSGTGYSDGTYYNVPLVSSDVSTTGIHATAKVEITAGAVSSVKIMDGGSSYQVGDALILQGLTNTTDAIVSVASIYDNIGDTIRISGISSEDYSSYNTLYFITGITHGDDKNITVTSTESIDNFSTTDIDGTSIESSYLYLTGKSIPVSSISYDNVSGLATIIASSSHGFGFGRKIKISGANEEIYNGEFVVTEVLDDLGIPTYSFVVEIGPSDSAPTATGNIKAHHLGFSSNAGDIEVDDENFSGRMVETYDNVTSTLFANVPNTITTSIRISGLNELGLNIGDYLMIGDEIVRISHTVSYDPTNNTVEVFRGVLGTKRSTHLANAVVRRLRIKSVEFRRHSIIRASGHTFEYVGFGPGNYSTALPERHDRAITADEELLAQSTKRSGGINFYTAMNDKGISYSGNKKMSTIFGNEEVFDTPISTVVGEDISNTSQLNVISPVEGIFSRSIRVSGGVNGKVSSEFNGPLIVNNKITSNSDKGIEANSLFLQGDATVSRNITVGISTPLLSSNPGDIAFNANPGDGEYVGWIFSSDNEWRRFGSVSLSTDESIHVFDKVGIATNNPNDCLLSVGSNDGLFCVDSDGVGIGGTANGYKLNVSDSANFGGNVDVSGTVNAGLFSGDGRNLTNLNIPATGWTNIAGGIYNTNLNNIGLGTATPRYNVEIGQVGTSTTSLYVNGKSEFVDEVNINDLSISGQLTCSDFEIESPTGKIVTGFIGINTTSNTHPIQIGDDIVVTDSGDVGIGTLSPQLKLDVSGEARFKSYSEKTATPSVNGTIATFDLSSANTFTFDTSSNIDRFELVNIPDDSTTFTIRIKNPSDYDIDIDSFSVGGLAIPVYWPRGVVPEVSGSTDIYSFKIFDGSDVVNDGIYGVVGGQLFS